MSVPLPFFVEFVIRNLILTTNTFWIALQYALRSTVECYRMLRHNQGRNLTQKRDTHLTKLLHPCNSVQANLYTKTKPNNFSSTNYNFFLYRVARNMQ